MDLAKAPGRFFPSNPEYHTGNVGYGKRYGNGRANFAHCSKDIVGKIKIWLGYENTNVAVQNMKKKF
jgi:hypothetical protein